MSAGVERGAGLASHVNAACGGLVWRAGGQGVELRGALVSERQTR